MKKKKFLIIFSVIILIFFIVLMCIGNYFFNYALVRSNGTAEGANRNVENNVPAHIQHIIEENFEKEYNTSKSWVKEVNKQDVSVISYDNLKLSGTKFNLNEKSDNYAIILHGYSQNKNDILDIAYHYYCNGYNVITPDLRAHGNSDGKYIGMGWLDRNDILKWIDLILEENPQAKIVLHGVSMGAATAMMVSGENLPKNVVAIIEDCGYTSVEEVFSSELKLRFNLPSFPIINCASFISRLRAGYNFKEASSLDQIKKSRIPILFIHGTADNFIPVEMCNILYDSATCKKEKLLIDQAGHTQSRFLQLVEYYDHVFNFIKN